MSVRHPVAALIDAFYEKPGNEAGGVLHIVTDDYNLETHHIEWSRAEAVARGDADAVAICDALLAIPFGIERCMAIGLDRARAEAWMTEHDEWKRAEL